MSAQATEEKSHKAFAVDPDELVVIGLDTKDGVEHPLYDKRIKLPVDENLAKDMLMNGFRGAIEVRKNGEKLEVVYGRQRVKAARRANELAKERGMEPVAVICFVKKGSDADLLGVRIGENIHRRDLGILDRAEELSKYMNLGKTEDEASVTFGMTKPGIKNLLKLQDLDREVRKALEEDQLSFSAAAALSELTREEQREELKKLLDGAQRGTKATRAAAKKAVKAKKTGDGTAAPPKRFITKLLTLDKRHGGVLNGDFVRGIMWTLGDIGSGNIKGLRELEKELEELKNEKKTKKTAESSEKAEKKSRKKASKKSGKKTAQKKKAKSRKKS